VLLVRHGETEWSRSGQQTGTTDLPLTPAGEQQARALGQVLSDSRIALVISSPLRRAMHTAELAGLPQPVIDPDLVEWNYGEYEGITTPDIRARFDPSWTVWTAPTPGGETPEQVGARVDRVIARARAALADGDVALVGHGHCLRVLGVRWLGLPPTAGAHFPLSTGTVSVLGEEHGLPAIRRWNVPADGRP